MASEPIRILLLIERFQHHSAQPLCFIHKRKIPSPGRVRLIGSPKMRATDFRHRW
jgi:hypothetical protein